MVIWPGKKAVESNTYFKNDREREVYCNGYNAAIDACKQAYANSSPALDIDEEWIKLCDCCNEKPLVIGKSFFINNKWLCLECAKFGKDLKSIHKKHYINSSPALVPLDEAEVAIELIPIRWNSQDPFLLFQDGKMSKRKLIDVISISICAKYGSPAKRVPSVGAIESIVLKMINNCNTPHQIAKKIRALLTQEEGSP